MILGVCSNKGGVGKTTVSTLLAATAGSTHDVDAQIERQIPD